MFEEPCLPLGTFSFNKYLNLCGCASPPPHLSDFPGASSEGQAQPSSLHSVPLSQPVAPAWHQHLFLQATAGEWRHSWHLILHLIHQPLANYLYTVGCTA